ncbi:MAG: general L-amino acid transport system permease protein [Verrucomicrobiales bacterium]|jgi:general L-amino acid transport system permease protein
MIALLLGVLATSLILVLVYVVGRLAYDTVQLFRTRASREDSAVLWRDVGAIGIAAQIVVLAAIIAVLSYLWSNFKARTDLIGLELNFDFLDQPGNISIADNPLTPGDTVGEAITQGFLNTIRIILIGIPLALILGTLIGVSRFSSNWILRKLATAYVEFFRNIPPLVVIVFLWGAVFLQFPRSQEAWKPFNSWFIFSNNRFALPSLMGLENFGAFRWILLVGLLAAIGVAVWRTNVFNNTGTPHHRVLWGLGTLVAVAVVAYFALGGPITTSKPELDDRGRVFTNGIRMQMPYAALTFALVIYTATHIAEIVRGSIMAVDKGQEEAANALALSTLQRYRFIILPQAMRVAFPPLISQFLNFTKNSSLALAIGFTESTSVVTNLFGQSQPAPQLILVLALLYLTLSLILSAAGNLVNRRLQIVGR